MTIIEFRRCWRALTKRQRDVLTCRFRGHTNKMCADALYVSENTVKKHIGLALATIPIPGTRYSRITAVAMYYGYMLATAKMEITQ